MRRLQKYKIYNSGVISQSPIVVFPSRIQKFNRPKWVKVKRILKSTAVSKKNRKPLKFSSFDTVHKPIKSFSKIGGYYAKGVLSKRMLKLIYDSSFKMLHLQKRINLLKTRREISMEVYGNLFYRLDILLYYTNFCASPYAARQKIQEGQILVNGSKVLKPIFLKRGDLVQYKGVPTFQKIVLQKTLKNLVYTSVECDYYTNTLLVLKDLINYNATDFSYLAFRKVNVKAIKDL